MEVDIYFHRSCAQFPWNSMEAPQLPWEPCGSCVSENSKPKSLSTFVSSVKNPYTKTYTITLGTKNTSLGLN